MRNSFDIHMNIHTVLVAVLGTAMLTFLVLIILLWWRIVLWKTGHCTEAEFDAAVQYPIKVALSVGGMALVTSFILALLEG